MIHTTLSECVVKLKQDSDRGIRGSELNVLGAIFTEKGQTNLYKIENGLDFAYCFNKILIALLAYCFLAACAESNTATPVNTFETDVEMLNEGQYAAAIYSILAKIVPRFKAMLPSCSQS